MALKTTTTQLQNLLSEIAHDLEKSERGNRAAAQRVRTLTIKFAKVAKVYRKESVADAKKGSKKKATTKSKKVARKKTAVKKKTTTRAKAKKKVKSRRKR